MNNNQEKPLFICVDKGLDSKVVRFSHIITVQGDHDWHIEVDLDQEWTLETLSQLTEWIKKVKPVRVCLIQDKTSKIRQVHLLLFDTLLGICNFLKVTLKIKSSDVIELSASQLEYLSHALAQRLSQYVIGSLPKLKGLFLDFKEWDIETFDITSCPQLEYIALIPEKVNSDLINIRIHGGITECFLCMRQSPARSINISCNQVSNLTNLVITGFSDLEGSLFERHPNLVALTVEKGENVQDSDIRKISSLQKLEFLCLSQLPKITDLSHLARLTSLEVLVLNFLPGIHDLSFLEELSKLKYMYVRVPRVTRAVFSGSTKLFVDCMMRPIPEDISRAAEKGDITYASIFEWDNLIPWKYHCLFFGGGRGRPSLSKRFGLYHI